MPNIETLLCQLAARDRQNPYVARSADRLAELVRIKAPRCLVERELELLQERIKNQS